MRWHQPGEKGFSLLELMLASTLAGMCGVLVAATLKSAAASKRTVELKDDLTTLRNLIRARVDCRNTTVPPQCLSAIAPKPIVLKDRLGQDINPATLVAGIPTHAVGEWVVEAQCDQHGVSVSVARRAAAGSPLLASPGTAANALGSGLDVVYNGSSSSLHPLYQNGESVCSARGLGSERVQAKVWVNDNEVSGPSISVPAGTLIRLRWATLHASQCKLTMASTTVSGCDPALQSGVAADPWACPAGFSQTGTFNQGLVIGAPAGSTTVKLDCVSEDLQPVEAKTFILQP